MAGDRRSEGNGADGRRSRRRGVIGTVATALLFVVIGALLLIVIAPFFLDRVYYRGPVTDHFDGARFFNPGRADDTAKAPGGRGRGALIWGQLTGRDGRPDWPTTVPVAQSRPAARVDGSRMVVTWVGHATALIQTGGINILTDPVYAERAGPFGLGPKRITAPGVRFEDLPPIDLIVVSHNHYDHMDLVTLKRLWDRDRPAIVTGLGNDALLRGAGIPAADPRGPGVRTADWGDAPVQVTGRATSGGAPRANVRVVRNHHWTSRWFADRNRALWSAFVIDVPGSGSIFFAGDTGMGDGRWIEEARAASPEPFRLAFVPIGAFRFTPGEMVIASHIGPVDAVEVARRLGATTTIPIHWGTFRLSYEGYDTPPRLLAAAAACTGIRSFEAATIGRPIDVPAYASPATGRVLSRAELLSCLDTPAVRALR